MHVVVWMMRYVEIEDVADSRNIEPARRNVGCNEQLHLAAAELIEGCGARRLIHVAVERDRGKTVTHQRAVQGPDFAFAVAEDDCVGEAFGRADQATERVALVMRLAPGLHQLLRYGRH